MCENNDSEATLWTFVWTESRCHGSKFLFLSAQSYPQNKREAREISKRVWFVGGMNQLKQSLAYWVTSLPTKKTGDRQILHQVTHSSAPEYFLLPYKVQQLHCGAFSCLRGWDAVTI